MADEESAGQTSEVPDLQVRPTSRWSFEWRGLLPVLLIVVVAVGGWQLLDGDDASSPVDRVATVTTTEPMVATTTTVPVTTTLPPTTTTTTSTTQPLAPRVIISGEMKPCRFGDRCLVAGFTIEGFDAPSGRFTCVYPNSRRDFSFTGDGKVDACLTADAGDTIAIEVDGVVSATISEDDLEGRSDGTGG